jgi:hypothetical protein
MKPIPRVEGPWELPLTQQREPDVLRLLARTEFALAPHVRTAIFPDADPRTALQCLEGLRRQRLVWRKALDAKYLPASLRVPGRRPSRHDAVLYGITPEGCEALEAWGEENDSEVLRRAARSFARDAERPLVRTGQLAHDLEAVDWVVSAVAEASRCPVLAGVRCELEYISAIDRDTEQPIQRFDALLILDFDNDCAQDRRSPYAIPWDSGKGGTHALRLALEIDRRTETLAVHRAKAETYEDLRQQGLYERTLGGDVLPVVVCPPRGWAKQLVGAWTAGAPGSPGIISTFDRVRHPEHGVLWGQYLTLCEAQPRLAGLWGALRVTLEVWQGWLAWGVSQGR